MLVAIAVALFYPPTASVFWQTVLVTEIGVAMLLAVGLNVVVGWAGLLDLGFIAFYALGSYTTAYFVGSLPMKPPNWLHRDPAARDPVRGRRLPDRRASRSARRRCDCAVTISPSSPSGSVRSSTWSRQQAEGFTNGSEGITTNSQRGTHSIPHPSIHIGPLHIQWGLNQLQYWYLLLVFLVVIVLLFRRLEHSRIGRAWAAIREDEVAAQATGINTVPGQAARLRDRRLDLGRRRRVLRQPGRHVLADELRAQQLDPRSSPTSCSAAWARSPGRWPARRC